MDTPIPTGLFDILPHDPKEAWRSVHLWTYLEAVIRQLASDFSFEEIRTPLFERTELFHRSVGDETDIVSKEMYTFPDRGGRSMSLRPEGTASVIRAFIEKKLHVEKQVHKLFYIGPMFRYERPQSGRYRQHHQFGIEVVGEKGAALDAEVIQMLYTLYARLGLKDLTVHINSLGEKETRSQFRAALQAYLRPHLDILSEDSKRRLDTNPLRILDSKDPKDQELIVNAPSILDFQSPAAQEHFNTVQELLTHLNIPFQVNTKLVRGLDYYTKTVFEVTSGQLGAQNTIGAGGRYDGLIKQLGGPDLPSIGFATGMERVLQTMLAQNVYFPMRKRPDLCIIPLGKEALLKAFSVASDLRSKHVMVDVDVSEKKLKQAMQRASEEGVRYVMVLGENELQKGIVELKEMLTGNKNIVNITEIDRFIGSSDGSVSKNS